MTCGPGCQLHKKLATVERFAKFFGLLPRTCRNCEKNAADMDELGVEWCRENVDTIVQWMQDSAVGQVITRFAPMWTHDRLARLVLEACDEADKEKSVHATQAIR